MTDWQKGDLALCVKRGGWRRNNTQIFAGLRPFYGEVLTVIGISNIDGPALLFAEYHGGRSERLPMCAHKFRKIRPSAIKHIEALKDVPLPVRENEHA